MQPRIRDLSLEQIDEQFPLESERDDPTWEPKLASSVKERGLGRHKTRSSSKDASGTQPKAAIPTKASRRKAKNTAKKVAKADNADLPPNIKKLLKNMGKAWGESEDEDD